MSNKTGLSVYWRSNLKWRSGRHPTPPPRPTSTETKKELAPARMTPARRKKLQYRRLTQTKMVWYLLMLLRAGEKVFPVGGRTCMNHTETPKPLLKTWMMKSTIIISWVWRVVIPLILSLGWASNMSNKILPFASKTSIHYPSRDKAVKSIVMAAVVRVVVPPVSKFSPAELWPNLHALI